MPANPRARALLCIAAGATVAALFASAAVPAAANPVDPGGRANATRKLPEPKPAKAAPTKWLVEVSGAPTLRGGKRSAAVSRQARVRNSAHSAGIKMTVLNSYSRVWNGFSVKASQAQVAKLRGLAGVTAVHPVHNVKLPEPSTRPNLKYSLPMIGADVAQIGGYDGTGIKVGIIDTGVDYNHPDLGGSGSDDEGADFPNAKVQFGYDLVGDNYDSDGSSPQAQTPVPDANPDDCNGHGTHVAGIIGADGDPSQGHAKGVAPKVTLGSYRVFGCDGSTDTEVILTAMDMAAADGMHVVNMSLGADFATWPGYPTAAAADALTAAGTLVVASAGNAGDAGPFSSGAPAVGKNVISVASVENSKGTFRYLSASPAPTNTTGQFPFIAASGARLPPTSGSVQLSKVSDRYGCTPLTALAGKVAVIQQGPSGPSGCSSYEKAYNAQQAGASAVVLYANDDWVGEPDVTGSPAITVPVVMVSQFEGERLYTQLLSGMATWLSWNDSSIALTNSAAGSVSGFSSYGMSADLTMNPDVAAPGGNIWSTFPIEQNSYANLSGTSMAAPHVAGAVALLLQAKGSLKGDAAGVRAALQNTSTPINKLFDPYSGQVIDGYYEPTVRQGAGLIHIDRAIEAAVGGTTVTPGKISLGENRSSYFKTTLKLTNRGKVTEKFKLSVINALNVGAAPTAYWFDFKDKKVAAKFSASTVSVAAGKTASVSVYLKQPSLSTGWIYGGWVKLTKTDNSKSLVVPFAGIYGDYQKVKVLQDLYDVDQNGELFVSMDLPALGSYDATADDFDPLYKSSGKQTFTLTNPSTTPYLLAHFDYPVTDAYFNVYKATATGGKGSEVFAGYKTIYQTGKMGRDDSYIAVSFDGKIPFSSTSTAGLTVPNGDYVLELRVLKALGTAGNSGHWETFVTPAFTINRSTP